jgi:hypothetical protein
MGFKERAREVNCAPLGLIGNKSLLSVSRGRTGINQEGANSYEILEE